ncbi:MAG TPA: amidohydrolase family protein [Mycobacteriales bacterium]|nr:amidohydrolase family protein [Mycobacteriales bacterium]
MRIDSHHHVWNLTDREYPWLGARGSSPIARDFAIADLVPLAAARNIERTVLVQALETAEETASLLRVAERSDLVGGVVGWVDLTAPDVADQLAATQHSSLVGIRHAVQSEEDPDWLARPDVLRGLAEVAKAGLVYDLLTLPHQLPAALRSVVSVPECRFVLDHLSKPPIASGDLEPWATRIHALAAEPNVVCKLSGMVTEASPKWTVAELRPYADIVLDAFGPERVMFGSDWPVCTLAGSYEQVVEAAEELTAGLSAAEREQVFGGTAQRVYGIS